MQVKVDKNWVMIEVNDKLDAILADEVSTFIPAGEGKVKAYIPKENFPRLKQKIEAYIESLLTGLQQ